MKLYLTRHGETPSGEQRDPPLTERGLLQAERLGERLRGEALDCILVSPLRRTVETAGAVAARQHTRTELLTPLLEVGTQEGYTGQSLAALRAFCPSLQADESGLCSQGLPLRETPEDILARAAAVIGYVRARFPADATVLLTAHGTFNNYLLLAALGFPLRGGFNFSQDNTGLSLVRYLTEDDGERTKLAFMNDTSHF